MTKEAAHTDEEIATYRRIALGDLTARNDMAWRHAGLVQSVATWYARRNPHLDMDDLIQEGRIGVIHALGKFNVDKGYRFSTYALFWIKHYIQRYMIANHSNVSAMKKDVEAYTTGTMDDADSDLYEIRCISSTSIHEPMPSGDNFEDVLPDNDEYLLEEIAEHRVEWAIVRKAMMHDTVTDKQRIVLCMKFGVMGFQKSTTTEIAKRVGCTQQAVSRIESEAMRMVEYLLTED